MTSVRTDRSDTRGAETMTTLRTVRTLPIALPAVLLSLAAWLAAPALATNPPDPGYDDYDSGYAGQALDPDAAGYEGSYSYVRRLEGSATLIQGANGDRQPIEGQQPVLAGDRIWVAPSGRVEVVLSDRNLLRIDGGSEVAFDAVAASPDRQDSSTTLRLAQGNVQLVVVDDFLGEDLPRIDTGNATVYPRGPGSYRITSGGEDWTEVVARDGAADVVTRDGSLSLEPGEEAVLDGRYPTRSSLRRASGEDSIELWGRQLDREASYADTPYVDDSLRYEAASLDRYGSWVQVEGSYGWRPRVAVDWRPYWDGRWDFSPLGLTWVSYEPWGWVPYHYGSWDYVNNYGWIWFPGERFLPAWVYWYWTDDYAGWIPVGYYAHYYHHHFGPSFGFRFGVYGWAGGGWGYYNDWLFCNRGYLGYRYQNRYAQPGDRFARDGRYAVPRRGLVTTDTRGITRAELRKGDSIVNVLAAKRRDAARELPDVTSFVARKPDLPPDVRRTIAIDRDQDGGGARRARIAVDRADSSGSSRRPAVVIDRPAARAPERGRPAVEAPVRPSPRLDGRVPRVPASRDESWRSDGARRRVPEPRVEAPPQGPPGRAPSRDEVRPRVVPDRPAPTGSRSEGGSARPRPSEDRPPAASIDAGQGWRDRRPVVDRQTFPPAGAYRSDRGGRRTYEIPSVPRRVIDGVRENGYSRVPIETQRGPAARPVIPPPSSRDRTEIGRGAPARSYGTPSRSYGTPPTRSYRPPVEHSRPTVSPPPHRPSSPPPARARSSSSHRSSGGSAARSRGSSGGRSHGSSHHSSRSSRGHGRPPGR